MENKTEKYWIGDDKVLCYPTKDDCVEAIREYRGKRYYLDHGEADRPHLTPRYIVRDGHRRWYIYAEFCYYEGTYGAFPDGPYERY